MFSGLFVPDTMDYMIAGYVVLTVVLSGYILSIFARWKKTKKVFISFKEEEK